MTMHDQRNDSLGRTPRIDDRSSGWLLPAVLAAAVIGGIIAWATSGDWWTAGIDPDTTAGQTTPSLPPNVPAQRP